MLDVLTENRSGSDFMVDVIKSLGIEYVASNPGSSFRGLHESVINYGGNENPEFITCCHEESAVAMAHGYAKIEGKPMAVFLHSDVGLQHGSMAIYNAFCDRVPVYLIAGNALEINARRPGVEWDHSVQDAAAIVRDCLKWDDVPISLDHFAESAVRAYKIAMTPPMAPVLLVADGELQEGAIPDDAKFHIPKLTHAMPPQGDSGSVAEAARMLVAAENPVILLERTARTADGLKYCVELAETLQAPVVDLGGAHEFPFAASVESDRAHARGDRRRGRDPRPRSAEFLGHDQFLPRSVAPHLGAHHQEGREAHQHQRQRSLHEEQLPGFPALHRSGSGHGGRRGSDAAVADRGREAPADGRSQEDVRGSRQKTGRAHDEALRRARDEAAYGWDASPITTARLCAEIWGAIKNEDWSLVCEVSPWVNRWPLRLWNFDKYHQYIGTSGGFGVGYGAPAALGAALANKKHGRLTVTIQNDGDLMYAPGVLWTSAHHHIPLLSVMHNNRAYHQEVMHVQRMADRHSRGIDRASIGTTITDPNINFAMVAKGMGVYSEGPITDPKDLGPAILRAKEVVKRGEPALVEAVTQPR